MTKPMNKIMEVIKNLYDRFFKKSGSLQKTEVKFERESPKIRRVNRILEVIKESEFRKCISANDGFRKGFKVDVKRVTFRWFDPTLFILNLGINDESIPVNLTPDCLSSNLDYTSITTWMDDKGNPLKNKFATLQLFKMDTTQWMRFLPYNPYPIMVKVMFFDEKLKATQGATFMAFYKPNKKYSKRWLVVHKGDVVAPLYLTKEESGSNGGRWHNPSPDRELSIKIQVGIGLQFSSSQYWHVDIGEMDFPRMRIPVNSKRLSTFFKLREIPEGSSRRRALIHWVSQHERRLSYDNGEKFVNVVKHFRGDMDFKWGGMDCQVVPSEQDVKLVSEPYSIKSSDVHQRLISEKKCADTKLSL